MHFLRMGGIVSFLIGMASVFDVNASAAIAPADVEQRLARMPSTHPRLFLPAGGEAALNERIARDPVATKLRDAVLAEADRQVSSQPVQRVLVGRRLLDKSRTCLSRVLHLGLAWRLTGQKKYADRARAELLAVAEFSDWNPSHFLDVAEMTLAVGIGYDWFFHAYDEPTRQRLRIAIVEKGLNPSLKTDAWSRSTNNWNQVCNAGMAVGALAVAKSDPALAARMIARAINTVPVSMHEYNRMARIPKVPATGPMVQRSTLSSSRRCNRPWDLISA